MCKTTCESILLRDASRLISKIWGNGKKILVRVLEDGTGLPVNVHESNAGFYIGTWYEEWAYSRKSADYCETHEEAQNALAKGEWRLR